MTNVQRADPEDDNSSWPYGALLTFGYFGAGTPEGRRHRNRSVACLAVFGVAGIAAAIPSLPWAVRLLCAIAVPLSWAGIVWSNIRYLSELDELSRLIQLEAAAISYGAVIVLASIWYALGALGVIEQFAGRSTMAVLVLPSFLFAELLRGTALALLARSRQ